MQSLAIHSRPPRIVVLHFGKGSFIRMSGAALSEVDRAGRSDNVLTPPRWTRELIDRGAAQLISARVPDAADLDAKQFEARTVDAYEQIRSQLAASDHPAKSPVRFWNHIPAIHEPMDAGRDRYMVFNAGRFAAFCQWYGGPETFANCIATASGVGHDGRDLVIHCLASTQPGVAI